MAWSAALDIAPQWLVALPLTALFALVFKSNYWLVAAAIQAESLLKVPLCALRIRTGKWIHDVTLPQGSCNFYIILSSSCNQIPGICNRFVIELRRTRRYT